MTTLLVILIGWIVLSIPIALLLARMFRFTAADARRREESETELRRAESDRAADDSTSGSTSGER